MNTRFLEAFVWAVRLGSFREAAERLNMTQAAISSRIASLEDEFGQRLFDRNARDICLTASGRAGRRN
jgi:DNA-binding transcriptional LysR family regulator